MKNIPHLIIFKWKRYAEYLNILKAVNFKSDENDFYLVQDILEIRDALKEKKKFIKTLEKKLKCKIINWKNKSYNLKNKWGLNIDGVLKNKYYLLHWNYEFYLNKIIFYI